MDLVTFQKRLHRLILPKVTKPTRYTGGEWNEVKKPWDEAKVRMVFAFPDVYEVGMSHLGMRILYHLVNDRPEYLMERTFAPWTDMEEIMRREAIPLYALESYRPVVDFDLLGFTLQYELSYTNLLNMLDLAGIPLHSADRGDDHPLVIAGGPCAVNPEPLHSFVDAFVIGEGEEVILEILDCVARHKKRGGGLEREALLKDLAAIPGVYVPAFYDVEYAADGPVLAVRPNRPGVPEKVTRRLVKDLDAAYFPTKPIVPFMEIVHNRIMLEVLRGCSRGCRFCQAGMIYRPVRERSLTTLKGQAAELMKNTGYDEIALTSLSTADYSCVQPLVQDLINEHGPRGVGISLPSLRVDAFSVGLAKEVQRVRKSGLTFAPEAGSQRMRDVINKGVTEEDLLQAVTSAFEEGWTSLKLYFMIGLPTETEEDLDGIAALAHKVVAIGAEILRKKQIKRSIQLTVSTSGFVPKPFTPFQWVPQDAIPTLRQKQEYLKAKLRDRRIRYNYHDAQGSFIEAVFAKGDRRLAAALEAAWKKGCRFDGWTEHFHYEKWLEAFAEAEIDPAFYAYREIPREETLPWDHIDLGVSKEYLAEEYDRALEAAASLDCRWNPCDNCGVCPGLGVAVDLKG